MGNFESLVSSADTEHIDSADKDKARAALGEAKAWLEAETAKQDALPQHADPVLLASALDAKVSTLTSACAALTKPKPRPKPAETPKPAADAAAADAAAAGEAAPAAAAEGNESAPAAAAPASADGMDVD